VLIGYESRPSGMQALFYFAALAAIALGMYLMRSPPRNEQSLSG